MRGMLIVFATLGLGACSAADEVANKAVDTAQNVSETVLNAASDTGAVIADGIDDVGNAIDDDHVAMANSWAGRWTGVEGTFLVISKAAGSGRYRLEMQYTLDDKGVFDGIAAEGGIEFTRPDGTKTLRHTDGNATGLKYLAGKKDCLTVQTGEGYCRD